MHKFLPLGAAAATGFFVGAAIVATRFVIDQTTPVPLALMRYVIGFCCLLPPLLMSKRIRFDRRDLLPIGLLGIAQFGIVVVLLNYALQFIPAARSALLFATFPLMTMVLSAFMGYEKITLPKTAGVMLTIVGVGLALGEKVFSVENAYATGWIGELAVLGSALSGAICSVLYKPYLKKYPTLPVSAWAMLASVIFLALFAFREGFFHAFPIFTVGGWSAVFFIGISSGIGYYLWLWALNHTTPTKVSVFLSLSPVTAMVLGALFLNEPISLTTLSGILFVALGLWFSSRR
jgi:drug/metabolite transporter (DMT)-like permease